MKYYLAPLEGITTYIYRNAYHSFFHPMDKYFTPFLVPHQKKCFNTRELHEILPEHNKGIPIVPQILTNRAEDFIATSKKLAEFGYKEVNLNLGCPSGTVVAKNRGSGFLALPDELDRFLGQVFSELDLRISLKTRIGKESPEEFYGLMEIFNQYPLEELIIHPRVQKDFYKNKPNMDIFQAGLKRSTNPVCYNGDLFTYQDYQAFTSSFQEVDTMMFGRGIIFHPGLIGQIHGKAELEKQRLYSFHNKIYMDYQELYQGGRNVLFKMKELWYYMIHLFTDHGKYAKRIKKSEKLADYERAVSDLFQEQSLLPCSNLSPFQ